MSDKSLNVKLNLIEENPASVPSVLLRLTFVQESDTSPVGLEKLKGQTTQVTVNGSTNNAESLSEEMNGYEEQDVSEMNSDSHCDPSESGNDDTETKEQMLHVFFSRFTSIVKEASAMTDMCEDEVITRWMNHYKGKPYRRKTRKRPFRTKTERKLRELISKMANEIGVPITDDKSCLQWGRLLDILANSGYFIDNYPDIGIPGSTVVDFAQYKPFRYISAGQRMSLINAIKSKDHPCTFRPYGSRTLADIRALRGSKAPVIMFMPSHASSEGRQGKRMFLNGSVDFNGHRPCKEQCDYVGEGSDETNKKRKKGYEEDESRTGMIIEEMQITTKRTIYP